MRSEQNAATEREGDVEIKSGESTILENQTEKDEERKETTADQRRKIEQTKKRHFNKKRPPKGYILQRWCDL